MSSDTRSAIKAACILLLSISTPCAVQAASAAQPASATKIKGTIDTRSAPGKFSRYAKQISLSATKGESTKSGVIDSDALFLIFGISAGSSTVVSVETTGDLSSSEFAIWPLTHPIQAASPYNNFRFQPVPEAMEAASAKIVKLLKKQSIREAQEVVDEAIQLLESKSSVPSLNTDMLKLRIYCETTDAFVKHWQSVDGEKLTENAIDTSRAWMQALLKSSTTDTVAQSCYGMHAPANQAARKRAQLFNALNTWALYSKNVYSAGKKNWPTGTAGNLAESDYRRPQYRGYLTEDLAIVLGVLGEVDKTAISSLLQQKKLSNKDSAAIKAFIDSEPVDAEAADVVGLCNLFSALYQLRNEALPTEMASTDKKVPAP